MRASLLPLLATLLVPSLHAQGGLTQVIPPSPTPAGFIYDGGSVLSGEALARLNARISALQASGKGDIGVAILRSIGDYSPNEVATAIGRAWGVGSRDSIGSERRDLGALLLIVPRELAPDGKGQCYIATATGAEGFINDGEAGPLCRESIIPFLRDRDYAGAVEAGIEGIAAELSGLEPVPAIGQPPERHGKGGIFAGIVGLLLVGGGGGALAWKRHKRRKPRLCPAGHGPMRLLDEKADDAALEQGQRKEESLKSVDYDVWECGECGHQVKLRYKRWFTSYSQCPSCQFWTVKTRTRTLVPATRAAGGLAETTRTCQQCAWSETRQHATPRITSSSSGSSGSSGGSSGGSSFGGSGHFSGGGGGSSY